jgi:sugar diacid utilization regulator
MTAAEAVAFAEGLSRIAASGGGAKALAEFLALRTGGGVLVEDAQWRAIASAGPGVIPASARSLAPGQGRSVEISAGDLRLGHLTALGTNLDALEHALRLTAAAIAVELSRDRETEPKRRRAFWERLAGQQYLDAAAARDDAAARGIALADHYTAVAVEFETAEPRLFAAAAHALSGGRAEAGTVEHGNTVLFFVPAQREIDGANSRTAASLLPRTLAKAHAGVKLAGGVGSRVPLMDAHRSVAQAQAALSIARRLYGMGHVGVYEDLGAYPLLLGGASAAQLRDFAARTLAPLRAYDEKHQTELERTLRLYFSVGENVKTAAEELSVHRHTVFYRLRQIGEISGCKLDNPHDQLTLRMAMAIDALTI